MSIYTVAAVANTAVVAPAPSGNNDRATVHPVHGGGECGILHRENSYEYKPHISTHTVRRPLLPM